MKQKWFLVASSATDVGTAEDQATTVLNLVPDADWRGYNREKEKAYYFIFVASPEWNSYQHLLRSTVASNRTYDQILILNSFHKHPQALQIMAELLAGGAEIITEDEIRRGEKSMS